MYKIFLVTMTGLLTIACSGQQAPSEVSQSAESAAVVQPELQTPQTKYTTADAAQLALSANPGLVVLDVRTPTEFNEGHIDGAINVDFKSADFKSQLSALDRNRPYLVHCRSGGRSTMALKTFEELGFQDITHLDGGMNGWKAAGLSTTDPCVDAC